MWCRRLLGSSVHLSPMVDDHAAAYGTYSRHLREDLRFQWPAPELFWFGAGMTWAWAKMATDF